MGKLEDAYQAWKQSPTPDAAAALMDAAKPVTSAAVRSYAGGDDSLHPRARLMALQAARTYDPGKGAALNTWMMNHLQGLGREARKRRYVVAIPDKAVLELGKLNAAERDLNDRLGREPADSELADHTGLSMRRIAGLRRYGKGEMAESALTTQDEDGEPTTFYPGTQTADPDQVWAEYVHHDLPAVDQKILEWRTGLYGKEKLQNQEIAQRLNLSPARVSQRATAISAKLAEGRQLPKQPKAPDVDPQAVGDGGQIPAGPGGGDGLGDPAG